jgi:hypothetical protein
MPMSSDQSPCSHMNYLQEKATRLQAWQVDLEAVEAELELRRQELARLQAMQPPVNDDDACMGLLAPCASPGRPTTWRPPPIGWRTSQTHQTQRPTSGCTRQDGSFMSPSSSRPRVWLLGVTPRSPDCPS